MNPRPPRAPGPEGKVSPVWFIVIGASVVLSALLIFRPSLKFLQRRPTPDDLRTTVDTAAASAARAKPVPPASNPRAGMGTRRLSVVARLSSSPYDFRFRDGRPINDESNYLGFSRTLPRASVQILGRPDDIAEAAYTDVILPDSVWKVATRATAMEFTRTIDGDMMPWVADNFRKVMANQGCFATRTTDGRTWTIFYTQLGPEGHFLIRVSLPQSGRGAAK